MDIEKKDAFRKDLKALLEKEKAQSKTRPKAPKRPPDGRRIFWSVDPRAELWADLGCARRFGGETDLGADVWSRVDFAREISLGVELAVWTDVEGSA